MSSPKVRHPVERVRAAYRQYERRDVATAAGFARMVGCSSSLLRNVESGIFPLSGKLALRIEHATGVSAVWLQSDPGPDDPIKDVEGNPWTPGSGSNLAIMEDLWDMAEVFYMKVPDCLPAFMGAIMESLLSLRPPQPEELTHSKLPKHVDSYVESLIMPVIRLVGKLEPSENEKFFDALRQHLTGQHAAEPERLLLALDLALALNGLSDDTSNRQKALALIAPTAGEQKSHPLMRNWKNRVNEKKGRFPPS